MKHADITSTRHHWGVECYAIVGDYLESRKYVGYTVSEARRLFYREFAFSQEPVICPNHEGAFDCTPFCPICEGDQEY
jgi:hypothetical protein